MARQRHFRRHSRDPAELDMTTFLNLMVVLVPFLLITAVFSRITIVELSLPSSTGGGAQRAELQGRGHRPRQGPGSLERSDGDRHDPQGGRRV